MSLAVECTACVNALYDGGCGLLLEPVFSAGAFIANCYVWGQDLSESLLSAVRWRVPRRAWPDYLSRAVSRMAVSG